MTRSDHFGEADLDTIFTFDPHIMFALQLGYLWEGFKNPVFKNGWRQDEGVDGSEHSVGGMDSGEWAKYTVDIAKAGRYRIRFRYGTPSSHPHTVDFMLDDEKIATLGPLKRHAAENWSADTVAEALVKLPSGRHVLMVQTFGQFNYADIEFVEEAK